MNIQRFIVTVLFVVAGGVVISGCTNRESSVGGMIVEPTGLSIGETTPDFPVVTADGRQTSFGELRDPIAIVAFVSQTGPQCCRLNPKLVSLAEDVGYRHITIAQISEPTQKCPHGTACMAACNLKNPQLVSLCDANRIAWHAYFEPKPNTIVLVGNRGEVVAVGSLANLDRVADKARRLAAKVEEFEESAYES